VRTSRRRAERRYEPIVRAERVRSLGTLYNDQGELDVDAAALEHSTPARLVDEQGNVLSGVGWRRESD